MPKLTALLTALASAAMMLLAGCDAQRIEKLEEGVATEADVKKQFGEPAEVEKLADGSRVLVWTRRDVPALAEENFTPSLFELLPVAQVGELVAEVAQGADLALRRKQAGLGARDWPDRNAVLATPALRERLLAAECVPDPSSPAEFGKLIASESASMARIVREARIQAE